MSSAAPLYSSSAPSESRRLQVAWHVLLMFGAAATVVAAIGALRQGVANIGDSLGITDVHLGRAELTPTARVRLFASVALIGAAAGFSLLVLGLRMRMCLAWWTALGRTCTAMLEDVHAAVQEWWLALSSVERAVWGVAIVGGIALRLVLLLGPIASDEAISYVYFSSRPLVDVLSDYAIPNNHVLHNAMAHAVTRVLGGTTFAIRLPAELAGLWLLVAISPVAFWLGITRSSVLVAVVAAFCPPVVMYAAMGRGYAITMAATTSALAAMLLYRRTSRRAWIVAAGAFAAVGMFAVPTAAIMAMALTFWMALDARSEPKARVLSGIVAFSTVAIGGAVFSYLPIVARSGLHSLVANEYLKAYTLPVLARHLPPFLMATSDCWTGAPPFGAQLLLIGIALLGLATAKGASLATRLGWCGVVALVLIVALQRRTLPPRATLDLLPIYIVLVVAGLDFLISRGDRWRTAVVRTGVLGIVAGGAFWMPHMRPLLNGGLSRADRRFSCDLGGKAGAATAGSWALRNATLTSPLVVVDSSGYAETIRFHVRSGGGHLGLVFPYNKSHGAGLLSAFPRFALLAGARIASDSSTSQYVARVLGVSEEAVRATFDVRPIHEPIAGAELFEVQWRRPPTGAELADAHSYDPYYYTR